MLGNSQTMIAPWHSSMSNGNIQVSLSLGESFVGTFQSHSLMSTFGFYQGAAGIDSYTTNYSMDHPIQIFPNPFIDEITIISEAPIKSVNILNPLGYLLFGVNDADMTSVRIPLRLSPGAYFVSIIFMNGMSKTYPIIAHQ